MFLGVFEQHEERVSEVQPCFLSSTVVESSSPQMKHMTFGNGPNLKALEFGPPTQVDFLHVGKEARVKSF